MVHELKSDGNATYTHVQHWMKSVYVKSQPVIDLKLFSFLQVSELAQGLQNWTILKKNPNRVGGKWLRI